METRNDAVSPPSERQTSHTFLPVIRIDTISRFLPDISVEPAAEEQEDEKTEDSETSKTVTFYPNLEKLFNHSNGTFNRFYLAHEELVTSMFDSIDYSPYYQEDSERKNALVSGMAVILSLYDNKYDNKLLMPETIGQLEVEETIKVINKLDKILSKNTCDILANAITVPRIPESEVELNGILVILKGLFHTFEEKSDFIAGAGIMYDILSGLVPKISSNPAPNEYIAFLQERLLQDLTLIAGNKKQAVN